MPDAPFPPRQYHLSRDPPDPVPTGCSHLPFGDWHLVLDSELTVREVVSHGSPVGFVFGTILDTGGRRGRGEIRLDGDLPSRVDAFERVLAGLVGRYVGIVDDGHGWRLYTDPSGALPAVYHPGRGLVAASPAAIPGFDPRERFRTELYEAVVGSGSGSWIPGEVTYHSGVRRLLPNHSLDLRSFEPRRFWPVGQPTVAADPAAEVEAIVSTLGEAFACIDAAYDAPRMALTAGRDSRSLLAAARPLVEDGRIALFTLDRGRSDVDVSVARRIARHHGLGWRPLPVVEATEEERRRWSRLTGHTTSSEIERVHPSLRNLDGDVRIEGLGGEIGRAYYWRDDDDGRTELDAADLLGRFGKPRHPALLEAVGAWLDGAGGFDTRTLLDLAYQEHRLGCWAGPQHLGLPSELAYVCPFLHRWIIESMHRLPPGIRRADELASRIVARCWPALNDVPYNEFDGWRRHVDRARDGLSRVAGAARRATGAAASLARRLR